jgi:hypothetical protein
LHYAKVAARVCECTAELRATLALLG